MERADRADDREQFEVLLIDDDEAFLAELSEALESLDYRSLAASSAREGLRKMADHPEIGVAKDVAAGAVLIATLVAIGVGVAYLLR